MQARSSGSQPWPAVRYVAARRYAQAALRAMVQRREVAAQRAVGPRLVAAVPFVVPERRHAVAAEPNERQEAAERVG